MLSLLPTLLLLVSAAEPAAPDPAPAPEPKRKAESRFTLDSPPLALQLADLDGNGDAELLVLTREAMVALRPVSDRFERYASLPLSGRPHRHAPARAPSGGLAAMDLDGDARAEVALMTSDLQAGAIVYWTGLRFHEVGAIEDVPVGMAAVDGTATFLFGSLQPGTNRFGTAYLRPVQREQREAQDQATPSLALAADPSLEYRAALTPEGVLVVWGNDGVEVAKLPGAGHAFALAEIEGHGLPELIRTDASLWPGPDRVTVLALGHEQSTLWDSGPVPGAVVAVAAGQLRASGGPSVVFAVVRPDRPGAELWEVAW